MSDAVQMLEEQHAEATALFMKLERLSDPATCAHVFRTLDSRLRDHTAIEEQIFYPAFRERAGSDRGPDEVREALSEHDQVKSVLDDIERTSPTDYTFKTKITELRRLVEHHVQEEEHGMLPQARKLFSQDELDELAYRMVKLMSIHSPVYQIGGNKVQTTTRDTIHRIGDVVAKITG
ncbi:MAG TPA: hemerythrin domain-containing protein [Candidatus Baltobacteraceae bacterium]|nr:hemerythrin domain-containing protein [Candidatus Baltobacteraceae bacterium]